MNTYFIRHRGNPDLVLSASYGAVVLRWRNASDNNQLWHAVPVDPNQHTYRLMNVGQNKGLSCAGYGNHLQLASECGDVWQVTGNGAFGTPNGIRLLTNPDWNLNVLGKGPFDVDAAVGVWNWNGGAGNELWTIVDSATLPNPTSPDFYALVPGYGGNYQLQMRRSGDPDSTPPLTIAYHPSGKQVQFSHFDWTMGFALQNRDSGKFIRWGGAGKPLQEADAMSLDCLWTLGDRPGTPYKAIRPLRDSDQNFNVFNNPGDPNGAMVGTWSWGGGQRNEVWAQDKIENPNG